MTDSDFKKSLNIELKNNGFLNVITKSYTPDGETGTHLEMYGDLKTEAGLIEFFNKRFINGITVINTKTFKINSPNEKTKPAKESHMTAGALIEALQKMDKDAKVTISLKQRNKAQSSISLYIDDTKEKHGYQFWVDGGYGGANITVHLPQGTYLSTTKKS